MKRGKHDCMVNRAFVFLLFSYLRTKGISFLSFFFPVILFFLTESFCCYKDVFEMYLTELKV